MSPTTFSYEEALQDDPAQKTSFSYEEALGQDEAPSALGSFAREAARSVLPGVAGTLAGAGAGALAGAAGGPLAPVTVPLAAIAGGIAAGMGLRKAQDVVADEVAPDSMFGTKSAQLDAETNPTSSFAGSLIAMGKPSLSAPIATLRAIGTAEGRAGVTAVAKSLVNKEARAALTKAVEGGDQAAKKSMENFGHVLGSTSGAGVQAGMGIAQGEDPLTATAKGVAGLAIKPWVGPGGVFLDPMRPPKTSVLDQPETAAPAAPEDVPAETPATPEEQQLIDDAIAGKARAVEAVSKAADVTEATGTLSQTTAALRTQAKKTAAKPVIAPEKQVAAESAQPAPLAPPPQPADAAPILNPAPAANRKIRGWKAAFELSKISQQEGIDLASLGREDYAEYAASKGLVIDDSVLRENPSHRSAVSMDDLIQRRRQKRVMTPEQKALDLKFNKFAFDVKKLASGKGKVHNGELSPGVAVRSGTADSNSWLFFGINEGLTGGSANSQTHKAYAGFSDIYSSLTPERVVGFAKALKEAGFNGDFKTVQDLNEQSVISDQLVMHGKTEADAQLAADVANKFFGDELNFTDRGIDSENRSYSESIGFGVNEAVRKGTPYQRIVPKTNEVLTRTAKPVIAQEGTKEVAPKAVAPEAAAPKAAPKTDPELDAAVSQAKTAEEFAQWAASKGLSVIRPPEGGFYVPKDYWKFQQPEGWVVGTEAPMVAPKAAAPEAPLVASEAPVVAPKPQVAPKPVAQEPIAPPENVELPVQPAAEITKSGQQLADKLGVDISLVPPNKQGKVSSREIKKWAQENPPKEEEIVPEEEPPELPKAEEPPAPEDIVTEEEPPLAPETEDVNTDLEIFPMQGDRKFTGVNVQNVSNAQVGLGLSPFRKARFGTFEEAELAMNDFDRVQIDTFSDKVHQLIGAGVNESAKAVRTGITLEKALVNLPDGYAATSMSRYSGATGMNWMRAIETLKTVKSGNKSDLFKQRSGGAATLYDITTTADKFDYVHMRLRQAGVKGATLLKNSKTNTVQVYVLVKNPSQAGEALTALKGFAKDNNYENIKVYKGDAETVLPDVQPATDFLRGIYEDYTSGGGRDRAGRADRIQLADKLGRLAGEVGIDLGPLPEYNQPRLDSRGRPLKDRATSVFGYERDTEQLKAAVAKIPAAKQARFMDLYVRAYDHITKALGMPRMSVEELGALAESSSGNKVMELYVKNLRKLYSENTLVPELKPRKGAYDADWETADGASLKYREPGSAFPQYKFRANKDVLATIALGDVIADLAKRVDEKSIAANKTKKNIAEIARIDKEIEALGAQTSRAEKTPKSVKDKLKSLQAEKEAAENQSNPWRRTPEEFRSYVENKLRKAVDKQSRVVKNAEKEGLKEVEDSLVAGESKESRSIIENAPEQEQDPNAGVDLEVKKAAYEALRNSDNNFSATDRYAIGKKLVQSGALNLTEIKALTSEIKQLVKTLDALDQSAQERNSAKKGNLGIEDRTAREEGELLANNYTLEELVARKHRRKDGQLRAARLYRPGEESPVGERPEPPKVLNEVNARAYLEILLRGDVAKEDAAQIRQLLKQANLDNIPLRVYDYLPRNEHGYYDPQTGEIAINNEMLGAPESNVETGLHEVHHALLKYFLDAKNEARLNPRQRKLVQDINQLYKQTTEAAIKDGFFDQGGLDQLRARLEAGSSNLSLPTEADRNAFAFTNVDEWTSAVMSNPDLRNYMKGLEMPRDKVTGKIRTAWEAFKDFVAKLFGMDRSVHRKAFDKIMELATDAEAGRLESEGLVAPDSLNYRRLFRFVDKIAKQNPSFRNPKTQLQHSKEAEEILRRIQRSDDQIEGSEAYSQLLDFVREISGRTSQDWARINGPAYELFAKGLEKSGPVDSRGPFANPPFYVREARRLIDRLAPETRRRWKRWPESNQDYSYAGPMPGEILTRPGRTSLITQQQDADYMAAVQQGDMETAQRMVEESANASGYTSPTVFHGSIEKNLTRLDPNKSVEVEGAIFFTTNEDVAHQYTFERAYSEIIGDQPSGDVTAAKLRLDNPLVYQAKGKIVDAVEMQRVVDEAKRAGHDGLIVRNIDDSIGMTGDMGDVYVVFRPDQVKSTNPITYDDNGNVIPLSKRFNRDTSDLRFRPNMGESPRFTRKVSEAKVNERLSDKDKVMFDSQTVPSALEQALQWKSNGRTLRDLSQPGVTLSNPAILHAAELFYEDAMAVKASVDRMKNPRAVDLAARRQAEDDIVESMQLVGRMVSEAGKTLGHSQYVGSRRTINIQDVYKTLLGKTPEEMASGKIDLQRMMDGIREIREEAAKTTMSVLGDELKNAGIVDEANLAMVRKTLSHTSSSYRDLLITLSDMMPSNSEAQTRALAEKMYRFYTISANSISKVKLPQIVTETYNGESTVPAGDQFLKKLSEFVKLGKYSEDEINSTLLESLNLGGYDKDFITGIRKDLFKIAAMPEGQMRDAASVEVNQKVKRKLYNNVLKFDPNTPQGHKHIMDMLTSAWQAGVLSGPPTSIVNLLGSAASTTVESFMEATGYALKTGDVRYLGDVYSGFLSALFGNKATGRASSARVESRAALTGGGTKYRNESIGDTPTLENIDTTGTSAPVKLVGGYAQKLRYVGRVMSALDAINMSMADEAKQRMVARFFLTEAKGHKASEVTEMMHKLFDPDEVVMTDARKQAEEDVKTYLSDKSAKEQERWVTRRTLEILTQQREKFVPGIAEAGKSAAERFTYNETARGFIGKTMVNLSAQINETLPAGRFVLSFMNTLANIMNQTLDYTPYGYLRAKNKWRVGTVDPNTKYARRVYKEGSPEQMAQMARASLGTSIMMAVAYMAYKGYEDEQNGEVPYFTVTGAGPKNAFDRQQLMDTGAWRPNSVKIGNTWYRYMDFPILGASLGFMGTMLDAARYKKDDQTNTEVVWNAALAGATTVFDKQLFQGANNFFEMLRGGQPGQQVFALKRLVGGTIGGFTNPGMARWLRNTLDMDSKGMVDRLDQKSTAGWVASMIPFSIGYNTPALNTLGEPIQQPWYSATTWRFADFDKSKPHPIITPLIQAGLMLPNPSPSTEFRILNPTNGTIIKTRVGKYPDIMRRFVELRGQALKQMLTPEYIGNLQRAALQNKDNAQDYLDSKIGGAARDYAVRLIEREISEGKLKL